jgi:RimJ/RimL family protein N-acetyltransferase
METERLLLRPFTEDDANHLFALDSDPEVMRWIGPVQLASPDAYRQMIRDRFLPYYQKDQGGFWATSARSSGEFLGWFHLRPALDYRFAKEAGYREGDFDLGYRLKRSAWGKGLATEGSQALIERAWTAFGARRIVSCALIGNVASTRVMEKVGLRRDGQFAIPGYEMPAVRYVLEAACGLAS